jgi:hypothetical protein
MTSAKLEDLASWNPPGKLVLSAAIAEWPGKLVDADRPSVECVDWMTDMNFANPKYTDAD